MKINNLGVTNTLLPSQLQADEAAAAGASTTRTLAGTQGFVPSSALLQLIHLIRQQPDVRGDHVQAAQQRLAQGYYHTQASAANTAAAMLTTLD
jgi:hypothetical protein